jgi:hypothetical protein
LPFGNRFPSLRPVFSTMGLRQIQFAQFQALRRQPERSAASRAPQRRGSWLDPTARHLVSRLHPTRDLCVVDPAHYPRSCPPSPTICPHAGGTALSDSSSFTITCSAIHQGPGAPSLGLSLAAGTQCHCRVYKEPRPWFPGPMRDRWG